MIEFVTGVVYALIGAATRETVSLIWRLRRERIAQFRGEWHDYIPPFKTEPAKEDIWTFRQVGASVHAEIIRQSPLDQKGKRWHFVGRDRGTELIGHFWNVDPSESAGAVYLIATGKGSEYDGFYLRFRKDLGANPVPIPVQLRKIATTA